MLVFGSVFVVSLGVGEMIWRVGGNGLDVVKAGMMLSSRCQ